MSDKYKVVSGHAEDLADGRIALPGEPVNVDLKDPHNQRLVDEGTLVKVDAGLKSGKQQSGASGQTGSSESDGKDGDNK